MAQNPFDQVNNKLFPHTWKVMIGPGRGPSNWTVRARSYQEAFALAVQQYGNQVTDVKQVN